MIQVNLKEAGRRLEALVELAQQGERVVITDDGVPVAEIVPYRPPRRGGQWRGQVWISDDFDAPMPEIDKPFGTCVAARDRRQRERRAAVTSSAASGMDVDRRGRGRDARGVRRASDRLA